MSDNPLRSAEEASQQLPQKTLNEFLESLHRIFKIGTYYPEGHAVLDRAAHLFQQNLQKITEAKRSADIELKGTVMLVEGQEITAVSPPVSEVERLFRDLGIGRIEIDRTVNLTDLLQFARTVLLHRSQLLSVKQFTKAAIVGLPSTIRINQKEFLVDEASILGEFRNDEEGQNLDSMFGMLEEQGLDRQQIAKCREFINTLARRFEKNPIKLRGMPAVSWQDVRKLMAKVVASAFFGEGKAKVFSHNDLNALSAIFNGLRQELDDNESRETINLLVTAFNRGHAQRPQKTEGDGKTSLPSRDKGTYMTIGEIESFVQDNYSEDRLLDSFNENIQYDELAVLLQLLQYPQDAEAGENIRRNLRAILTTSFSLQMVDVLVKGIVHLAECTETIRLREAVDFVALQLRGMNIFSSLPFLVMLCRRLQPIFIERLWPTMINELLAVGRQAEQQRLFNELASIAAGIPGKVMRDQLLELEVIESIRERKIADDIFAPELRIAYPLYAVLLETSMRMQVASRVLAGLRAAPPDWLIEAVAPLMDLTLPEHVQFLQSYLAVAQQKRYPVSLHIMAGKLVVERLPMIDEAVRNLNWVVQTIKATAQLQVDGTRDLLEKILTEKKMIVVPKWPSPCREAATQTLKRLKRKPLG